VTRRRRRDGPSGSLFPFLSVLACVIGTLTLSLAALALGQLGGRSLDQVRLTDRFEALQASLANAREQLEDLDEAIDEAVFRERQDEELRERLAGLGLARDISLEELEAVAELRRELEEAAQRQRSLEREGQHLTAIIEAHEEEIEKRGALQRSAPIVIDPSGLGRELRPYLVECTAHRLEIHSTREDLTRGVPKDEIRWGPKFKRFLRHVRTIHNSIVIFLIREGGVETYVTASEIADQHQVRHAKLPIPGDGELDLGLAGRLNSRTREQRQ
jgi:Skp family chaperone for outer membrane proteins